MNDLGGSSKFQTYCKILSTKPSEYKAPEYKPYPKFTNTISIQL